jgi:ribosomal protein S16
VKKEFLIMFVLVVAVVSSAFKQASEYRKARREGAIAHIDVHVVDDAGNGISNANVCVFFGMNFAPLGHTISGVSNANGIFACDGNTCGDEIVIEVCKTNYYSSYKRLCFATMGAERDVRDGRWLPFGENVVVNLRDVRHPLNKEVRGEFSPTKALNRWIGFDLNKNDYVAPDGDGEVADLDVFIEWDGKWYPHYRGMAVRIRFRDAYSGFYPVAKIMDSQLRGPYQANVLGEYKNEEVRFYTKVLDDLTRTGKHWNENECWVVRSRCEVDENGNLVKANYSVVMSFDFACQRDGSGAIRMIGLFNPTPNDTNLEPMSYEAKKWLKSQKKGVLVR